MVRTALAMMRRAVSPIPIGRTPGRLSRAIRRLASRGLIAVGSTYDEHSLCGILGVRGLRLLKLMENLSLS